MGSVFYAITVSLLELSLVSARGGITWIVVYKLCPFLFYITIKSHYE